MTALDPRTKLVALLAFTIIVILTANLTSLAFEGLVVALVIIQRGSTRDWLRVLRTVALLTFLLFTFYVLAFDWQTALASALRLLLSVSAFFLFFQITAPEDLANSLVQSGVPYAFAFILTSAMQFTSVITRQTRDIFDAQRARGIRLEPELASARNFTALLAPLLINAFALAEQLAETMEARGFGSPHRTFARQYYLAAKDFFVIGLASAVVIAVWTLKP